MLETILIDSEHPACIRSVHALSNTVLSLNICSLLRATARFIKAGFRTKP
jgi:hypothetical protein